MKRVLFTHAGALLLTHLQVLSGLLPFHHLSPVVACAVLRGERPGKPPNALSISKRPDCFFTFLHFFHAYFSLVSFFALIRGLSLFPTFS